MSRRELALQTLTHKNSGHVPYAINLTSEGVKAYGDMLLQDYPCGRAKSDLEAGILSKAQAVSLSVGNHLLYVYPPWWDWYNLTDEFLRSDDAPDYLPDTIGQGSYFAFFDQIRHIRKNYDVYIIATIWGSHWEKAYFARGIENFLSDLAGDPEWAQRLLDLIIRKNLVMLENVLAAPEIDGVLLGSDWGTQRDLIMSPACWREMIKDGERKEYDLIKSYGKHVFVHSCGNITRIMDDLVELGVDCLNPIQPECMDIYELKKKYGGKLSFFGGISTQKTLPYGTPEEVREETCGIIESMSKNGGYFTAPSQEIQEDVPYENLRMLIDTAQFHA